MKPICICVCVFLFTFTALGQESASQEWKSIAYIEFVPSSSGVLDAIAGMAAEEAATTKSDSTEKTRVETLKTVDPATGKTIVETETIRSGSSTAARVKQSKTSLLSIEGEVAKDDPEKVLGYRISIDGDVFFVSNAKEIKRASKIAKEYLRARQMVAKGAKVQPFIELVFGDKDKGFVVHHETKSVNRDALLKIRIWVKGKSFDLSTTPGAATFVNDVSRL